MNCWKIIKNILKEKRISLIILFLIVLIKILNRRGIYIFINTIEQRTIFGVLCMILLFLAFFWIKAYYVFYRLLVLLMAITAAFTIRTYVKEKETIFIAHSPDKEHTILIQDKRYTRYYYKE